MVVSDMMPPRGIHISINNQDNALHNIYPQKNTVACFLKQKVENTYCLFWKEVMFLQQISELQHFWQVPRRFYHNCNTLVGCGHRINIVWLLTHIFYLHLLNMVGSEQCINIIFGPLTWIYPENYWGTPFLQRATHSGAPVRNWCNYLRTNSAVHQQCTQ